MHAPSRTVLVVDDDASIRLLCRVNLELAGWTVHEAATLEDARTALRQTPTSVVLLDVHVGSGSGMSFLDELRRGYPEVRVALLTGSVGSPSLDLTSADAVIAKPFTLDVLIETVRSLAR